jgi:magnesium chelatase family protein
LLDRIDLQVHVPRLKPWELAEKPDGESSASVRERVIKARKIQKHRNDQNTTLLNASLAGRKIEEFCAIDRESKTLLINAARRFALSARGYDKVLTLARTIADLDEANEIAFCHLAEALQYRTSGIFEPLS